MTYYLRDPVEGDEAPMAFGHAALLRAVTEIVDQRPRQAYADPEVHAAGVGLARALARHGIVVTTDAFEAVYGAEHQPDGPPMSLYPTPDEDPYRAEDIAGDAAAAQPYLYGGLAPYPEPSEVRPDEDQDEDPPEGYDDVGRVAGDPFAAIDVVGADPAAPAERPGPGDLERVTAAQIAHGELPDGAVGVSWGAFDQCTFHVNAAIAGGRLDGAARGIVLYPGMALACADCGQELGL